MNTALFQVDWLGKARAAEFKPKKFAEKIGVGTRLLRRHFAVQGAASPEKWLVTVRVWTAAKLLRAPETKKIIVASVQLGFADEPQFCHQFRRVTGMSPRDFVRGGAICALIDPELELARLARQLTDLPPRPSVNAIDSAKTSGKPGDKNGKPRKTVRHTH